MPTSGIPDSTVGFQIEIDKRVANPAPEPGLSCVFQAEKRGILRRSVRTCATTLARLLLLQPIVARHILLMPAA